MDPSVQGGTPLAGMLVLGEGKLRDTQVFGLKPLSANAVTPTSRNPEPKPQADAPLSGPKWELTARNILKQFRTLDGTSSPPLIPE